MSTGSHFSMMPNINIPRTRMVLNQKIKGSAQFGKLVPLDGLWVIPADTHNIEVSGVIQWNQFIKNLYDDVECNLYSFFVPFRLLYDKFESWFTSNTDTGGDQGGAKIDFTANAKLPYVSLYSSTTKPSSICSYFGKPIVTANSGAVASGFGIVNTLKERAYYKIWTDWFIPRQFVTYTRELRGNAAYGALGTYNDGSSHTVNFDTDILPVCKNFDYFTAATLSPQYATAAVNLPLGDTAPILIGDTNPPDAMYSMAGNLLDENAGIGYDTTNGTFLYGGPSSGGVINKLDNLEYGGLYADLSSATAATVNDLRYAFALQKFAERANFGNRMFEALEAHYGITSPDARLQRSEYLGHASFLINIDPIVSTAGYNQGSSQQVGATGAVSITKFSFNLGNKGFVEPGVIIVLLSTRQKDHSYSQGILRDDFKLTRFEYYSPEFANLGDQSIFNKEIYLQATGTDELTFGYQEHWAEARYLNGSRVVGLMNPNVSGSFDYWTLADKFGAKPDLSAAFLFETRDNLKRVMTVTNSDDFVYDIKIKYLADRPMPAYTIPGLIDHFGTR